MDIGTGIAIAGAWLFAGMMGTSSTVTSLGLYMGVACAIGVTIFLGM